MKGEVINQWVDDLQLPTMIPSISDLLNKILSVIDIHIKLLKSPTLFLLIVFVRIGPSLLPTDDRCCRSYQERNFC